LFLRAQAKVCRHDDHQQKHDADRPKKETEGRLRNAGSADFAGFCHSFGTVVERISSSGRTLRQYRPARILKVTMADAVSKIKS
jgi:hypothetical protein